MTQEGATRLRHHLLHEALTPETRRDGHDEDHVNSLGVLVVKGRDHEGMRRVTAFLRLNSRTGQSRSEVEASRRRAL